MDTLAQWHRLVATRDPSGLDALLADEVVFHSPVVHTPQRGPLLTRMYLTAAMHVLGNASFRYVREVVGAADAVLEFEAEVDDVTVNGIDMIHWDAQGRIIDFKVMVRPAKAMALLQQKMAEMLSQAGKGGAR
jgi:hypothetical protein